MIPQPSLAENLQIILRNPRAINLLAFSLLLPDDLSMELTRKHFSALEALAELMGVPVHQIIGLAKATRGEAS